MSSGHATTDIQESIHQLVSLSGLDIPDEILSSLLKVRFLLATLGSASPHHQGPPVRPPRDPEDRT
jgi:hypothetical protein